MAEAALAQSVSLDVETESAGRGQDTDEAADGFDSDRDWVAAESALQGLREPSLVRMAIGASVNDPCVVPLVRETVLAGLLLPSLLHSQERVEADTAAAWLWALIRATTTVGTSGTILFNGWQLGRISRATTRATVVRQHGRSARLMHSVLAETRGAIASSLRR